MSGLWSRTDRNSALQMILFIDAFTFTWKLFSGKPSTLRFSYYKKISAKFVVLLISWMYDDRETIFQTSCPLYLFLYCNLWVASCAVLSVLFLLYYAQVLMTSFMFQFYIFYCYCWTKLFFLSMTVVKNCKLNVFKLIPSNLSIYHVSRCMTLGFIILKLHSAMRFQDVLKHVKN